MTDKSWNLTIKYHEHRDDWSVRIDGDTFPGFPAIGFALDYIEATLEDGVADGSEG